MKNLIQKLLSFFNSEPRILCVHSNKRSERLTMAAQWFIKKLDRHPTAAIVCSQSSIVHILKALDIQHDEKMKWWPEARKIETANQLLKHKLGDNVSLSTEETIADLLWLDGTDASKTENERSEVIFSGRKSEEPFIELRRRTLVLENGSVCSGTTPSGCKCAEWTSYGAD